LHDNNKQLDGLVKPKRFASVLSERIGFESYIGRIYFYPTTHMIFPGGSLAPGSHRPNVWSIDMSARPRIDT